MPGRFHGGHRGTFQPIIAGRMGQELRDLLHLLGRHKGRYALGALFLVLSDGGQRVIGQTIDALDRPAGRRLTGAHQWPIIPSDPGHGRTPMR